MIKYFLFLLFSIVLIANQTIKIENVTKDGIYLNIGTKNGVEEFSELFDKSHKIKIKIIKVYESHSIACLIAEDKACDYNIEHLLKIKNKKFFISKSSKKKLEEKKIVFVRNDIKKFENIPKNEISLFKNNNKVFDLVIFNHDNTKKDINYRLSSSINLYTIGGIELQETDLNYLNPILQSDLSYKDENQELSLIFDANLFLQKNYSTKAFNFYEMNYGYKYNKFTFKIGRNNLSDIGDFYLTDGVFVNYKNNNFKLGLISAFGIDYYNSMKTDFKHIYLGGYGNYHLNSKNFNYSGSLGFIPEIFNNSLGILPIYINNSFSYKEKFNIDYQFKMSYSKLNTSKNVYFNNYLTAYYRPFNDLKLMLGVDFREYLDLINYSYYETILEKINSDKSKNIYANISYKFNKDLLSFMYKHRINQGGSDEISLRYFNYVFSPFEYSLGTTALLMKDVNIFMSDINLNYIFFSTWNVALNLFAMLEQVKDLNDNAINIAPNLSIYKKIGAYFYIKGESQFELRSKKVSVMIKLGYIFDSEIE